MLAGRRRGLGLRPVRSVRRGDDDGLDIGPGQERLVRLVGLDPELLGQRGGAFATPDEFVKILRQSGFVDIRAVPLTFGIVYLYMAGRQ